MKYNILTFLLHLACILPLIVIAYWQTGRVNLKNIGIFAILFIASGFLLYIPSPAFLTNLIGIGLENYHPLF